MELFYEVAFGLIIIKSMGRCLLTLPHITRLTVDTQTNKSFIGFSFMHVYAVGMLSTVFGE